MLPRKGLLALVVFGALTAATGHAQTRDEVRAQQREALRAQEEAVRIQEDALRESSARMREAALVAQNASQARAIEIQNARSEMEQARRQLEEAARAIAVRAEPLQAQYLQLDELNRNRFINGTNYSFGAQPRLGATIVNADNGVLVTGITPGQGAEDAGLRVGDVIESIDGIDLAIGDETPTSQLLARLREVEPGESVSLVVERGGRTVDLDVETRAGASWVAFGNGPGSQNVQVFENFVSPNGTASLSLDRLNEVNVNLENLDRRMRGLNAFGFAGSAWSDMELITVTEGLGRYFDTDEGLLVVSAPDDDAIDIQEGDVILSISGRTPNSPEHAIRILSSFESGETIELEIMRDGRREDIEYEVPAGSENAPGFFWRFNDSGDDDDDGARVLPVPTPD